MADFTDPSGPQLGFPKAVVSRLIDRQLPAGVKCAKSTTDIINACLTAFVTELTTKANSLCEAEGKKRIAPRHLTSALETMGLPDCVPATKGSESQDAEGGGAGAGAAAFSSSGKRKKRKKLTAEEEAELAREQEAFFRESAERRLKG